MSVRGCSSCRNADADRRRAEPASSARGKREAAVPPPVAVRPLAKLLEPRHVALLRTVVGLASHGSLASEWCPSGLRAGARATQKVKLDTRTRTHAHTHTRTHTHTRHLAGVARRVMMFPSCAARPLRARTCDLPRPRGAAHPSPSATTAARTSRRTTKPPEAAHLDPRLRLPAGHLRPGRRELDVAAPCRAVLCCAAESAVVPLRPRSCVARAVAVGSWTHRAVESTTWPRPRAECVVRATTDEPPLRAAARSCDDETFE